MVLFLFIIMMLELAPGGKSLAVGRQRWIPVLLLSLVTLACTVVLIALDPSAAAGGAAYHATPRDFGTALFDRYALACRWSRSSCCSLPWALTMSARANRAGAGNSPHDRAVRHVLLFAAILFVMGLGCVLARRNLIMILIGVEIMLNAAAVALVGGSAYWRQVDGQVFVVFLMAMTSAEVAISLAMVVYLRRRRGTLEATSSTGCADEPDPVVPHPPLAAGLPRCSTCCSACAWPRLVAETLAVSGVATACLLTLLFWGYADGTGHGRSWAPGWRSAGSRYRSPSISTPWPRR